MILYRLSKTPYRTKAVLGIDMQIETVRHQSRMFITSKLAANTDTNVVSLGVGKPAIVLVINLFLIGITL